MSRMDVIRYLNGKQLQGTMPQMMLAQDGVGAILREMRYRQELPLPEKEPSAILNTEEIGLGKDIR